MGVYESLPIEIKSGAHLFLLLSYQWTGFTKSSKNLASSSKERKDHHDKVFGEPLRTSLKYASVAISMAGDDGNQYVWGYVPIIVAKVGLFLKENGACSFL
jgi:hypothetical protein